MKYTLTLSCGHEETVDIYGSKDERKRKIWYYENHDICSACAEAHRKAREEEADQMEQELGLPELSGSPKQVAWAKRIRLDLYQSMTDKDGYHAGWGNNYKRIIRRNLKFGMAPESQLEFAEKIIENPAAAFMYATSARYYIDNFGYSEDLYKFLDDQFKAEEKFMASIQPEAIAYEAEITVEPEKMEHDTLCTIKKPDGHNCVSVKSDYDRELIDMLKARGFKWSREDKEWFKNMKDTDGKIEDRIAEIGNALLNAGWPVRIPDAAAREKAVKGTFEPTYPRWIYSKTDHSDTLYFMFDDDIWDEMLKATIRAKRSDSTFYLPVSRLPEIEEIAETYGFKYTAEAQRIIDAYKANRIVVAPAAAPKVDIQDHRNDIKDILNSEAKVLDRLTDD